MTDIQKELHEVQVALKESRELIEKGSLSAEEKGKLEKIDALQNEWQEKSDQLVREKAEQEKATTELKERLADLEAKAARPTQGSGDSEEVIRKEIDLIGRALKQRLTNVHPSEQLSPEEVKTLRTDNLTDGGYLVPDSYDRELVKKITEISNVRALARVRTIDTKRVNIPKRSTLVTAYWVGEGDASTASNSTYARGTITAQKQIAKTIITNEDLEDAFVNMRQLIVDDAGEELARQEGAAFVSGNGIEKPFGFMQSSQILESVSGLAATFTADNLIDLASDIKTGYTNRAVYGMNRSTIAFVRKLKDGNGNYLWQNGSLSSGTPNTFMGYPVVEMPDLDDIGAGAHPVVFGDFTSGYTIVDRIGTSVLVDPYSNAGTDEQVMYVRRRVGGDVVLGEALVKLKCAVS